ncbi:MAG: hypothetical protein IJO63_01395 [Bacilli bacterium]|nr:hypothetical protein [Bacilli bacterium]
MIKIKNKSIKILITILLIILSICTIAYLSKLKVFKAIEKEYIDAAEYIYKEQALEDIQTKEEIILTRQEINILFTSAPLSADCNGYVIIVPNGQEADIKAYIKCADKYQSYNFDETYLE